MSDPSVNLVEQIESFGKDAAENEDEDFLAKYFLETEVYKKAAQGSKTIIIGRKGSGKSAIFRHLQQEKPTNGIKRTFVEPDDNELHRLRQFVVEGLSEQSAKSLIWKYLLLILIARFVVETAQAEWPSEKEWPASVRSVRKFLVDNDEFEELSIVERAKELAAKIRPDRLTIKLAALGEIGIESRKKSEAEYLDQKIDRLQDFLLATLQEQNMAKHHLHIYVDQVDEVWMSDKRSEYLVIGLLLASQEINNRFKTIRCVVFLRTDIYQKLRFHDQDKLHGEEAEILWDENSLIDLLHKRVQRFVQLDRVKLGTALFPGKINGIPTLQYIIQRTLLRPRDLIQFCNLCREKAQEQEHPAITTDDVLKAEVVYSKWKLGDLATEYQVNYPFLNDLLVFSKNLEFTTPQFSRASFSERYAEIKPALEERYGNGNELAVEIILIILYNINFIGIVRSGKETYRYDDPNTVTDVDEEFIIHPAFWQALGMTPTVFEQVGKAVEETDMAEKKEQPEQTSAKAQEAKVGDLSSAEKKSETESAMKKVNPAEKSKARPEKLDTTEKSQSIVGSKAAAKIVAGTDEVKMKFRPVDTYFQDSIKGFSRVISNKLTKTPSLRRANYARAHAYLHQAVTILKDINSQIYTKEARFTHDQEAILTLNRKEIARACHLIEASIRQLEFIPGADKLTPHDVAIGNLPFHFSTGVPDEIQHYLTEFYLTLVDKYNFDMLEVEHYRMP